MTCCRLPRVKFQELYMTTSWVSGAVVPAMGPQNTAEVSAETPTDRNVSLHCSCALTSLTHVRHGEVTNIPFFHLSCVENATEALGRKV